MAIKTYGSVNGQSKELKTIYGSVNGQSKKLVKLYGSVNGVSKLIYEGTNDETQYGKVYYYSTFTGASWSDAGSTNMQIQSIDIAGLSNFVMQRNVYVNNGQITMYYWADGNTVSYERGSGGSWSTITVNELYTQYNIQAWRGPDYNNQGTFLINYSAGSVDKTSTIVSADLLSSTEYTSLGNTTSSNPFNTCTVGGNTIPFAAIQKFVFGTDNTTAPGCFLRSSGVEEVDFSYAASLASVGTQFLSTCADLTTMSTLPTTLTTIGNLFLEDCTSFNQALDLSHVTSIGSSFLSGCTSFNGAFTIPANATIDTEYFLRNCTAFNQPFSIPSTVTAIGGYFLYECTSFNQSLVIPSSVTEIGPDFLYHCAAFNQNITIPETVTRVRVVFMSRCESMTSTIAFNTPSSSATFDTHNFSTNDSTAACYTTGITFDGPYGAEWKDLHPDKNTSPYRKILCADTTEDYGVVYHYGYTEGWVSAGWTQNVTWEITNQATWNSWVSLHGGATNAQFNFWYENNIWKVYIQTTGAQTSIADMLEETGITVTSTVGGFQEGDGWSMKYGISVDTSTGILKTTLVSTADFNNLVSSSDARVSWALSQRTVYSAAVVSVVVGATITSLPNGFLRYCTALEGVYIPSSVTTIGDNCLRYTSALAQPLNLGSVTTIGQYFMYHCTSFNGALTLTSLQSVGAQFLASCTAYNKAISAPALTSIGNNFLYACSAFNSTISIPAVTTIGSYFLARCTSFNYSFSLTSVTTIGAYFMQQCTSFNKNLTFPSSITNIGQQFMNRCDALTSTLTVNCAATGATSNNYTLATNSTSAACYVTGIKLAGTYKNEWHTKFPDRTSNPYRKTIVA